MKKYLLTYLFISSIFIPIKSQPRGQISNETTSLLKLILIEDNQAIPLEPYCKVWVDMLRKSSMEDIILEDSIQKAFVPLDPNNIDINAHDYWLQYKIQNLNQEPLDLQLQFYYFEFVDIFLIPDQVEINSNVYQPLISSSYKRHKELLPLSLPPGKFSLYLHVKREQPIYIARMRLAFQSVSLYNAQYHNPWQVYKGQMRTFNLLFLGALGIMFLYNLVSYFIIWDKNYLYYISYLFFLGIFIFVDRDFYAESVYPDPPVYFAYFLHYSTVFILLFQLLFARNILDLKHYLPLGEKLVNGLILSLLLIFGLGIFNQYAYFYTLLVGSTLCCFSSLFLIALFCLNRQRPATFFYFFGNIGLFVGALLYLLDLLKLIPSSLYTANGILFGAAAEMALFSLGLANKINEAKKTLLQRELENSNEQNLLIEKQKILLAETVLKKTKELNIKNSDLEKHISLLNKSNLSLQETLQIVELQKKEIEEKAAQLAVLNDYKDKLFSIISHDLRSPIHSLQGMLSILETEQLDKEEIEIFSTNINKRLQSIDSTLDELLQWSQNQLEGEKILSLDFLIHPVIESVVELFIPKAESKKILILNTTDDQGMVLADINHFKTILRNLLSNALKFTREQGSIVISSQRTEDDYIVIAVKDTGIGMSKEKLDQIFSQMSLFSTQGTDGEKGTGLGLLLCKEMIDKNGGRFWAESSPGEGSTFYFSMPSSRIRSLFVVAGSTSSMALPSVKRIRILENIN